MIIGFIYASEDSDSEVTDTVKEAAEKKLEKLDLTIDDLVDYFLQLNQANTQVGKDSEAIDVYAAATDLQNRAVDSINVFIRYRKAGFRPRKAEAQVRRMIEVSEELTLRADSLINSVHTISPQYKQALLNLRESIMDLAMQIYKHKLFLERYYATKPSLRGNLLRR